MAGYQLDYSGFNEIMDDIMEMADSLPEKIKPIAEEIGEELRLQTAQAIPRGTVPKHDIHLADDVKCTVKSTNKNTVITIKGGAKTGGYWWNVDNGHIATNGRFVPGAHFTDTAYNAVDVEGPIDALLEDIARK